MAGCCHQIHKTQGTVLVSSTCSPLPCPAQACIESCEALYPGCFTYYYDHGCCLCKPTCSDGTVASTAVDPLAPASTCAPTVQVGFDSLGLNDRWSIHPNQNKLTGAKW